MAANGLPERTHIYRNRAIDSRRWDDFEVRDDDVIVSTSYKGGTTWTQNIVGRLVFGASSLPQPLAEMSPWVDAGFLPPGHTAEVAGAQSHRRFLKTHLALDGLIYHPNVKYIFVLRDGRDVAMSMWNHLNNYSEALWGIVNDNPWNADLDPHPPIPETFHEFYNKWLTTSLFEWENEGWPYWSHFHHAQTWWDYKHLPNILSVHFNDMLADLRGEIGRIADYLEISLPGETLDAITEATTFDEMKKNAANTIPTPDVIWRDPANFFHKGVNGRWREVLTADDLKLYDQTVERTLTPDLRTWMESGGHV